VKQKEMTTESKVKESLHVIRAVTKIRPKIALVLGSGLGDFADTLESKCEIEITTIPHYPRSTVEGHKGKLVFGKYRSIPLLVFQGRIHYYESGKLESVLYPIRIAHGLGVSTLIVTNAAGGINDKFHAGDLMMITDHINLTFENPLKGIRIRKHHKELYDKKFQQVVLDAAAMKNISLQQGVYCGLKGPAYETAAEVEMTRRLSADAVGMSTVNEVAFACGLGMRVAGISCITNLSTGITGMKLSHEEVTVVANRVKQSFSELLGEIITTIGI
jgi:purine-nucleoside phosphorylase